MTPQHARSRWRVRSLVAAAGLALLTALVALPAAGASGSSGRNGPANLGPSTPEGVDAATLPGGSVRIDWGYSTAVTDIARYVVRRNGKVIATVGGSTLTAVDPVPGSGRAAYTVEAVDTEGRSSSPSEAATPDGQAAPVHAPGPGSPAPRTRR